MIVCATVVSLAFAGDHTFARTNRGDGAQGGPLAVFSVADRVPVHLVRDRFGLGGLSSIPDPFIDVVSLAVVGLSLIGMGRRLARRKQDDVDSASALSSGRIGSAS